MTGLNLFKSSFGEEMAAEKPGPNEVVSQSSMEETDEALDSCVARGGQVITLESGKKVCRLYNQSKGQGVGNKISGLLAEDPTAAPSGILGVIRKAFGL